MNQRIFFCFVLALSLVTVPIYGTGRVRDMEIIAHRGASYDAPENTLASVRLAWRQNADAVEVDIYLTKDKRIMINHDPGTKRTSGVDWTIADTSSDQLRQLDVGHLKGEQFRGEKIPFLEEVLEILPPGKRLFVEIKCGKEILPYLKQAIEKSGKAKQIVLIGFGLETMVQAARDFPRIPCCWLRSTVVSKETKTPLPHDPEWIKTVKKDHLAGLDLNFAGVTQDYVTAAKKVGLKFFTWTVDDPDEARRLKKLGVDGITTNRPEFLRQALFASDDSKPK